MNEHLHERLMDVVAHAITWDKASDVLTELSKADLPGLDPDALKMAEGLAYEALLRAVLDYADDYRAWTQVAGGIDTL